MGDGDGPSADVGDGSGVGLLVGEHMIGCSVGEALGPVVGVGDGLRNAAPWCDRWKIVRV